MKNYKNDDSIEALLSGCDNTTLKSLVSSILRKNEPVVWSLVSWCEEGSTGRAEFTAPVEGMDSAYHLTCETSPQGVHMHNTVRNAEINQHGARKI